MGQQTSAPKITSQDRAVFQLKQQRDKLKQYQTKLSNVVARETELAKQAVVKKDTERAKFFLRSKKGLQSNLSKTYEQLENIEKLIETIEYKVIEKDVLSGLQQGNQVLKQLNAEMSIEKIDKILDDLEDESVKVSKVLDLLGSANLSLGDEEEIDREFAQLEQEAKVEEKPVQLRVLDAKLPDIPAVVKLPDAPVDNIESGTPVESAEPSEHKQEALLA